MTEINIQYYKASDLIMAEYNPRQLTKDQYVQLKDSIERFGLVDPLIVNKHKERKNILVGGHQRLKIAREMGVTDIPCVEVDLSLDQEKELNIRLNKNVGEWDYDSLANNFDVGELKDWGFSSDELQFYEEEPGQGLIDDDEIPEVGEAITKQGDLWLLGDHRLLCGDATKKEDVDILMDGKKADMVFTDPPYGIDVVGDNGSIGKGVLAKEGKYKKVIGDNEDFNPTHLLSLSENLIIFGANYFCDKLPLGQWLVWDKNRPKGTTFSDCELIWTTGKGIAVNKYICTWNGMTREGESGKRVHPTQKPLKLLNDIFEDFKFKICIDPYLGSGSTLIACEKTNRKCYGMELDPHYCDVIVKRWEGFTGKKAERVERVEG